MAPLSAGKHIDTVRCFRMHPSSQDPSRLLADECQQTEPWGSSEHGAPCDKCNQTGQTRYVCWSCVLTGDRKSCPVCSGAVRWEAECPVCRGSGSVHGKPRRGVSTFPTLEGLYHYMLTKEADLDDCVVVELEGELSGELDFDADQGAMLVIPELIVGCARTDHGLAREIEGLTSGLNDQHL